MRAEPFIASLFYQNLVAYFNAKRYRLKYQNVRIEMYLGRKELANHFNIIIRMLEVIIDYNRQIAFISSRLI